MDGLAIPIRLRSFSTASSVIRGVGSRSAAGSPGSVVVMDAPGVWRRGPEPSSTDEASPGSIGTVNKAVQ